MKGGIMSEKLFILCQDDLGNYEIRYGDEVFHFLWEVAPILNEQQSTIEQLERKLELKTEEVEYLKRMMVKWGMVKDE